MFGPEDLVGFHQQCHDMRCHRGFNSSWHQGTAEYTTRGKCSLTRVFSSIAQNKVRYQSGWHRTLSYKMAVVLALIVIIENSTAIRSRTENFTA